MQPVLQAKHIPDKWGQTGWGWGMWSKVVHTGSDLRAQLLWPGQTSWGEILDQYQSQNAGITSALKRNSKKRHPLKQKYVFLRSSLKYFSITVVGKLPMSCTRPEGNQGRAMVCQDLLDPNEPRGAFGAEPLNLRPERRLHKPFQESKSEEKPKVSQSINGSHWGLCQTQAPHGLLGGENWRPWLPKNFWVSEMKGKRKLT